MCGIVGVYDRCGKAVDPAQVAAMRDTMRHRGPDDEGLWLSEQRNVALGHRRLAIVDLTPAGRAPMGNEDGSVQVTFNGEIYNHSTLRFQLIARGHIFRSRCDTEVLVHMWEEYGQDMVDHLIGMFAFAIWDENTRTMFAARDRLGIKPLYWFDDGDRFAFASEIKALLPLLKRREVDPVALRHYLTFVAVPAPRTLFAGVSKLAPANVMLVDDRGPRTPRCYWDALTHRAQFDGDATDWASELRFRLERSIDRRMMSDVPVGALLSGGVDSSTNVALMSRVIDDPVNTFSIGYHDDEEFNEFAWARQVAEQFGARHHEVEIGHGDLWTFMSDLVFHQDEPISCPVCVPMHYVSKLAKDNGVTVVHVGEGADEIFSGYDGYVRWNQIANGPWRRYRALPRPLRMAVAAAGTAAIAIRPSREAHVEVLRRAAQVDGHLWWGGAVAFAEHGFGRLASDKLRHASRDEEPRDIVAAIRDDASRYGARDELDRMIYQDIRLRLPELLLMRVDKLTMANAVEARVPFLDHEFVEFAMAVPTSEKIRDGVGKHVLKRTVSDLLPHELVWRKKQGFGTPISRWFRGELGTQLEHQLETSAMNDLGYLRREEVRRIFDLHKRGRVDRSFQLWNILNVSVWFDHWIAGEEPALLKRSV